MADIKNYYQMLGVAKNAAEEEIKAAFRKLAKKYHPDAHPGDEECEQKFREINEAYRILGDAEQRKKYDEELQQAKSAKKTGQEKQSVPRQRNNQEVDFENIHQSFASFFGFDPREKKITNEEKLNPRAANPLDTTDLFERFMGIKR